MEDIYADLDNKTPCIFILSTGADPTSMLLRFAKVPYGTHLHHPSIPRGRLVDLLVPLSAIEIAFELPKVYPQPVLPMLLLLLLMFLFHSILAFAYPAPRRRSVALLSGPAQFMFE